MDKTMNRRQGLNDRHHQRPNAPNDTHNGVFSNPPTGFHAQYPPQHQQSQYPPQQMHLPQQQMYPRQQKVYPPQQQNFPPAAPQPQSMQHLPRTNGDNSYAAQVEKWKRGKQYEKKKSAGDREVMLVNELCTSRGTSSYPPRDALGKLSKHLKSCDAEYMVTLVMKKMSHAIWQVIAKALSVLNTLLSCKEQRVYGSLLVEKLQVFRNLCKHEKSVIASRAEKVVDVLDTFAVVQTEHIADELMQDGVAHNALIPDVEYGKLPAQESNEIANTNLNLNGGFNFVSAEPNLNTSIQAEQINVNENIAESKPEIVLPALKPVDPFQAIEQPNIPNITKSESAISESETCKIHNAFEDLNFEDDDHSGDFGNAEKYVPQLHGSIRKIYIDIDVPPGPLGIALDTSIESMAVIREFLPLPDGSSSLLSLHPVLCAGCSIHSINGQDVSSWKLEEVGPLLGKTGGTHRDLIFCKTMINGNTINPANPAELYSPPCKELPEGEIKAPAYDLVVDTKQKLDTFQEQLARYESDIMRIHTECTSGQLETESRSSHKRDLAQLNGHIEKLLHGGIDTIIIGQHDGNKSLVELKNFRSTLTKQAEALFDKIASIDQVLSHESTNNTSSFSFLQESSSVNSPNTSAFDFLSEATNSNSIAKEKAATQKSAFDFM